MGLTLKVPSGVAKLSQPIKNITGAILNKKGVATKFYTKTWKNEFENNFEKMVDKA